MRPPRVLVPLVMQTANQREPVRHAGELREQLADLQPGDHGGDRSEGTAVLGRCGRLQVEQVDVTRPAIGPHQNHREIGIERRLGCSLARGPEVAQCGRQTGRQRTKVQPSDPEPFAPRKRT
jgi:hypothetical protein